MSPTASHEYASIQQGRARCICAQAFIAKTETPETDWGNLRETTIAVESLIRGRPKERPRPVITKDCLLLPWLQSLNDLKMAYFVIWITWREVFQNKKLKKNQISCSFSDVCPIQGREIRVQNCQSAFSCHIYSYQSTLYKNITCTILIEQNSIYT